MGIIEVTKWEVIDKMGGDKIGTTPYIIVVGPIGSCTSAEETVNFLSISCLFRVIFTGNIQEMDMTFTGKLTGN